MGLLNDITKSYLGLKGKTPTTYTVDLFNQKVKYIKYITDISPSNSTNAIVPKENRFIISVKTDNQGTSGLNQFTIPTRGERGDFNYDIETSDGQTITGVTGTHTITFPSAGTYDVKISGVFPRMYFNDSGDKLKMVNIKNFGIYALDSTSQESAFHGCLFMVITATDIGHFENVANFNSTWAGCSNIESFPLIDTSNGTEFDNAFSFCVKLTSFPLIDVSSGISFGQSWFGCTSLANFPSNSFDTNLATNYGSAFGETNLTTQSIDDILVSLDTSGVSNGTFAQSGGQAPSATGLASKASLVLKGWTVTTS